MGASGSISASLPGLGDDLCESLRVLDVAKVELAKADEESYRTESGKIFKDHSAIIDLFTKKSKSQLAKLVTDTSIKASDIEKLLGSDYGKFCSALTETPTSIDLNLTKVALSGVGADEELLISIFCCRSAKEIQEIAAAYERETSCKLVDKVKAKTFKDPKFYNNILSVFFSKILVGDRYEGSFADMNAAADHARQIKLVKNSEFSNILDILCYQSREHCLAIHQECLKQFKQGLDDIIKDKLGKVISYEALRLWVSPLPVAFATMFDRFHNRTEIVLYSIARTGKRDLRAINEVCKANFKKPLKDVVDSSLSGNFKKAVISWIESPAFDGGCEEEMNAWLLRQEASGYTMQNLMEDSASYDYVAGNIQQQIEAYKQAGFCRNEKTLQRAVSEKNIKKISSSASMTSVASSSENVVSESQSHEQKTIRVKEYLSYLFQLSDIDASNEMSTVEFNSFLAYLNLTQFGYTQDEIDILLSFCDSDGSDTVSFDEAVYELTDMVINGIENSGEDVISKIEEMFTNAKMGAALASKSKKEKKTKKGSTKGTPAAAAVANKSIPADLQTYLMGSFEAFDLDSNGILDRNEFWQLMNSLNLGLTNDDIENLQSKWDVNQDGGINWKEALPLFTDLLHSMASDQRDHFIGLLDRESGYLFWYNLRDKSTQWMSEEDQALYAPGKKDVETA